MVQTFLAAPSSCQYLSDRVWQLRYVLDGNLSRANYMDRLREGWRRFGPFLFRPECPSCRMCQSLRVPAASFRPSRSQLRAWRANVGEVDIRVGSPSLTPEKLDLFARFHRHGQDTKRWPAADEGDLEMLLRNPFPTEEWCYYVGERLIGVGYVDTPPEGLSAIYFFHDPEARHRSIGTFNIMQVIASATERGLPHVYLGYFVEGCRSLEYKSRFRPNEVLRESGAWDRFIE